MKQQASGGIRPVRRSENGPLLVEVPLVLTPWASQLLGAFGGKHLHLRGFLDSIALTAGVYALTPVLDVASYVLRSQSWAGGLYRVAGYVFVTGAAMSLAASVTSLGDWRGADEITAIRLPRRGSVLLTASVLGVAAAAVYRFLPEDSSPSLGLVAMDLALLALFALFALSGPAGTGACFDTTVSTAKAGRGPDEWRAA